MTTRAVIGDVHGCYEEFEELVKILLPITDEIWHCGDLVDRGPDSGRAIQVAIDYKLKGVRGNHEQSILRHWEAFQKTGNLPGNPSKARTIKEMNQAQADYLAALPRMHVFDDQNLVVVHGGLWPGLSLWQQPDNVIRAQMILPTQPEGHTRWWGPEANQHRSGCSEEQNREQGFRRWYEVYDGVENVVYGHSVFTQPYIHQNPNAGWTVGVDTGNVFGGVLTAGVFVDKNRPYFISVPPKRVYCADKLGQFLPR